MNLQKPLIASLVPISVCVFLSFGCSLVAQSSSTEKDLESKTSSGSGRITDLRRDLQGTTWKLVDPNSRRPGLGETLTFEKDSVQPEGYRYEVSSSRVATIIFRGGDRQDLNLDRGAQQLELKFQQRTILYKIAPPPSRSDP